jgi:hypothetical protein
VAADAPKTRIAEPVTLLVIGGGIRTCCKLVEDATAQIVPFCPTRPGL